MNHFKYIVVSLWLFPPGMYYHIWRLSKKLKKITIQLSDEEYGDYIERSKSTYNKRKITDEEYVRWVFLLGEYYKEPLKLVCREYKNWCSTEAMPSAITYSYRIELSNIYRLSYCTNRYNILSFPLSIMNLIVFPLIFSHYRTHHNNYNAKPLCILVSYPLFPSPLC